jgi:hypothetical protein
MELDLANVQNVNYTNVMNIKEINSALSRGTLDAPGLFPHVEELGRLPYVFAVDFGLRALPEQPGVILVMERAPGWSSSSATRCRPMALDLPSI